jgi:hypothetical protein
LFDKTGHSFGDSIAMDSPALFPSFLHFNLFTMGVPHVGPATTTKTLKQNSHRVHRTTFRGLTEDELKDPDEVKARKLFDEEIEKHLGPSAKQEDFSDGIE